MHGHVSQPTSTSFNSGRVPETYLIEQLGRYLNLQESWVPNLDPGPCAGGPKAESFPSCEDTKPLLLGEHHTVLPSRLELRERVSRGIVRREIPERVSPPLFFLRVIGSQRPGLLIFAGRRSAAWTEGSPLCPTDWECSCRRGRS